MFRTHDILVALLGNLIITLAFLPHANASGRPARSMETAPASSLRDDAIVGYWQRNVGEALVEIRREGRFFVGRVVSSERRPELVGTELFRGLRYDDASQVWRGRVFSVDRDREFDAIIRLSAPGHIVLTVRVAFIRKRVEFTQRSARDTIAVSSASP